jgi:predicted nucleic acid-binding protein
VTQSAIVDSGPLVAFLDRREKRHAWVAGQMHHLATPILLCEPVLVETAFLLARSSVAQDALFGMLENETLKIGFHLDDHISEIRVLLEKYRDIPMSLADASLVRMAEVYEKHAIFTLDFHFTVYRKHGKAPLKLVYPREG